MKPVCVKCECEFKPHDCGIFVAELFKSANKIYRLWMADIHKCKGCGTEIVTGYAAHVEKHYEKDLEAKVEELKKRGARIVYWREKKNDNQPQEELDAVPAM